jgi:prefoldin subunit 5
MSDLEEREKVLESEIADLDEQMKKLAVKMEEIAGTDCDFGSCVLDPAMESVEEKIEEVQRRKKAVQETLAKLEASGA